MNFHQQQQLAMAQQMSAQHGGMTPQQQQQIAMANQMAAQYGGGMTPQQQAQIAQAQAATAQYGGAQYGAQPAAGNPYAQPAYGQPGAGTNPYAQPAYGQPGAGTNPYTQQPAYGAQPGYPPPGAPVSVASNNGTIVSVNFPDGCIIGWDRLRNELIINGKSSNTRLKQMPARPIPGMTSTGAVQKIVEEEPAVPVERNGMMTKLGWKKTVLGGDSWQPRFFRLTDTSISYAKDANSPAISTIPLHAGITVSVVNAATPARKNRYENNDAQGVGTMMSMNIGGMMSQTSGPIGRENCVEMVVSGQIGTMIDGVMAQNVTGLAFGGGMQEMKRQGQGRTYYMSCNSRMDADEWRDAIANNIKALPKEKMPGHGEVGGANGYSGVNAIMNNLKGMQESMKDIYDPSKSLQWYMNSLGTQLPAETVFMCLSQFYNELDRANVPHP